MNILTTIFFLFKKWIFLNQYCKHKKIEMFVLSKLWIKKIYICIFFEVLFTPSNCGVNRFMDKNGLLGSARREKFSSTPGGHDKPAEVILFLLAGF